MKLTKNEKKNFRVIYTLRNDDSNHNSTNELYDCLNQGQ